MLRALDEHDAHPTVVAELEPTAAKFPSRRQEPQRYPLVEEVEVDRHSPPAPKPLGVPRIDPTI